MTSDWLVSVLLPKDVDRDQVMTLMRAEDVDSRPVFYCSHQMPMYVGERGEQRRTWPLSCRRGHLGAGLKPSLLSHHVG